MVQSAVDPTAAASGFGGAQAQPNAASAATASATAADLRTVMGSPFFVAAAVMTEEHNKYIKTMSEALARFDIMCRPLAQPQGAHVFYRMSTVGLQAVILMFEDMLPRRPLQNAHGSPLNQPLSDAATIAQEALKHDQIVANSHVQNFILIEPNAVNQTWVIGAINYVKAVLGVAGNPDFARMTAKSFSDRYSVTTDPMAVRQFTNMLSPHSTPAASNLSLVLSYRSNKDQPTWNQWGQPYDPSQDNWTPVIGVEAMVDIVRTGGGMGVAPFAPVVRITNVVSAIPTMGAWALGVSAMATYAIGEGCWVRPFMNFQAGAPDLGSLVSDQNTGKVLRTRDANALQQFLQSGYLMHPVLAVDVTEGRARIPGVHQLLDDTGNAGAELLENLSMFFGGSRPGTGKLTEKFTDEFIGRYNQHMATPADSRGLTYLNVMAQANTDVPIQGAMELLNVYPMPQAQAIVRANFATDLTLINRNSVRAFYPAAVQWLINSAAASGIVMQSNMNGQLNMPQTMANLHHLSFGGMGGLGGFTPFGGMPGVGYTGVRYG